MWVVAAVTLKWAAYPPALDEESTAPHEGAAVSCASHSAGVGEQQVSGAGDETVYLVSEALVRVPREALFCPSRSEQAGQTASSGVESVSLWPPALHSLVWMTARHCVTRLQLEIAPQPGDSESDAAPRQLLPLPESAFSLAPYEGAIHFTAPSPSSSSLPSVCAEEASDLADEKDGTTLMLTTIATNVLAANNVSTVSMTNSVEAFTEEAPMAEPPRAVASPSLAIAADATMDGVPARSLQGSCSGSVSGDPLVLTLDLAEDSTEASVILPLTGGDNAEGEEAEEQSEKDAATQDTDRLLAFGRKRPRDVTYRTEAGGPNEVGIGGSPVTQGTAPLSATTPAPQDPASVLGAAAHAPRRRLRLALGNTSAVKPEEVRLPDAKTEATLIKREEDDGASELTSPAHTPPPPPLPSTRRLLRLVRAVSDAVTLKAEEEDDDDENESCAREEKAAISPCDSPAVRSPNDQPESTVASREPEEQNETAISSCAPPWLISVRGLAGTAAVQSRAEGGGVSVSEETESFFSDPHWPDRVCALVLTFASPDSVSTVAALEAWKAQDLTRLLTRPRAASRLTHAEMQNGPAQRHFYGLGHPRFSTALCPCVSPVAMLSVNAAVAVDDGDDEEAHCAKKKKLVETDRQIKREVTPEEAGDGLECAAHRADNAAGAVVSTLASRAAVCTVRGPPLQTIIEQFDIADDHVLVLTSAPRRTATPQTAPHGVPPTTTVSSITRTRLSLFDALPLPASQVRFLLRVATTLSHCGESHGGADSPSRANSSPNAFVHLPRLGPPGARTARTATSGTAHDADNIAPPALPPTHDQSVVYKGLTWRMRSHSDGTTCTLTPPDCLTPPQDAPRAGREMSMPRVQYVLCEPFGSGALEIVQHVAPLHFLLLHVGAWWRTARLAMTVPFEATQHVAESMASRSAGDVSRGGSGGREDVLTVLSCAATNWALDTQRGAQATVKGITLSAALIRAATRDLHNLRPHTQSTVILSPHTVKAIATVASALVAHLSLRFRWEDERGCGGGVASMPLERLVWQVQAQAQALGYVYTLTHLPRSLQSQRLHVSEAHMSSTSSSSGANATTHLATAQTSLVNACARTNLLRDQHRLAQWLCASRDDHTFTHALLGCGSTSDWRTTFVVDYFMQTAAALPWLAPPEAALTRHITSAPDIYLLRFTNECVGEPSPQSSIVAVDVSAQIRGLMPVRADRQRDSSRDISDVKTQPILSLSSQLPHSQETGLTLPLTGLLFAVERRTDTTCTLDHVSRVLASCGLRVDEHDADSDTFTASLPRSQPPHSLAALSQSFRVVLYEAAPLTWTIHASDAVPGHTPHVYRHRIVLDHLHGADSESDALATLEKLLVGGRAAKDVAARRQRDEFDKGTKDDAAEERDKDDDSDAHRTEAAETYTWVPVALLPLVTSSPDAGLHVSPSTLVLHDSLAAEVDAHIAAQAAQYITTLALDENALPEEASTSANRSRKVHHNTRKKRAAAEAAVQAEVDVIATRLSRPLAQLWAQLLVHHVVGHALLCEHYGPLLARVKEEVEARADCLSGRDVEAAMSAPENGSLLSGRRTLAEECRGCDGTDLVASGLMLLEPHVASAYGAVLIALHHASRATARREAVSPGTISAAHLPSGTTASSLEGLLRHPTRIQSAVQAAAATVLEATQLATLRRHTSQALSLINISRERWRKQFRIKAELKNAPAVRLPVEVDVSPLEALIPETDRGDTNRSHADVQDGDAPLPSSEMWDYILRTNILLL